MSLIQTIDARIASLAKEIDRVQASAATQVAELRENRRALQQAKQALEAVPNVEALVTMLKKAEVL